MDKLGELDLGSTILSIFVAAGFVACGFIVLRLMLAGLKIILGNIDSNSNLKEIKGDSISKNKGFIQVKLKNKKGQNN